MADLKPGPLLKHVLDDAPFMAVELHAGEGDAGRELRFRTNADEWVTCGPSHPLRFETEAATGGLKPYVHVRADLWARATRAVWLELAELGEVREIAGLKMFGVVSAGEFYAMAPASILLDDAAAEPGKLRPGLSVAVHVDERQSTGTGVDERPSMPVCDNDALALSVGDARQ